MQLIELLQLRKETKLSSKSIKGFTNYGTNHSLYYDIIKSMNEIRFDRLCLRVKEKIECHFINRTWTKRKNTYITYQVKFHPKSLKEEPHQISDLDYKVFFERYMRKAFTLYMPLFYKNKNFKGYHHAIFQRWARNYNMSFETAFYEVKENIYNLYFYLLEQQAKRYKKYCNKILDHPHIYNIYKNYKDISKLIKKGKCNGN